MLTILKTSKVGGLQIHLDGTWIDVDPVDGFIVNLGLPFSQEGNNYALQDQKP